MLVSQKEWARATDVARLVLTVASFVPALSQRSLLRAVRPALTIGVAAGSARLIQHLFGRRRPNGEDHHSMPSQHTTESFAMATAASALPEPLSLAVAGGVAAGRVLANKHYVSDVIAGALLGLAASAAAKWMSELIQREQDRSDLLPSSARSPK